MGATVARDTYSPSVPQKAWMLGCETVFLIGSAWILFGGGFQWIASIFGAHANAGSPGPRMLVFLFTCVVYAMYWVTMGFLIRREIPSSEAAGVIFAFGIYYLGYAFLVFQRHRPLDWIDALAALILLAGIAIHTISELQRHVWKRRAENKGKLYTGGLFRFSMHINYFGDVLWVCAFAIVTRNLFSVLIPLMLVSLFIFSQIPDLEKHLAAKYGEQFAQYSGRTKKLIPFVW